MIARRRTTQSNDARFCLADARHSANGRRVRTMEMTMPRTEKQQAREAANQQRSLEAFMAAKAEFDALIAELQAMSADHFGADPETVVWGYAEMLKDWNTRFRQITDAYHRRGEYAV
jgi:spore germination protein YaaH